MRLISQHYRQVFMRIKLWGKCHLIKNIKLHQVSQSKTESNVYHEINLTDTKVIIFVGAVVASLFPMFSYQAVSH